MTSLLEKGGGTFPGIKMLLCENPLPPLDEAIAAAQEELGRSNFYTEAYSAPLRRLLSEQLNVPEGLIHINAGSGLILRQLFARLREARASVEPDVCSVLRDCRILHRDASFASGKLHV